MTAATPPGAETARFDNGSVKSNPDECVIFKSLISALRKRAAKRMAVGGYDVKNSLGLVGTLSLFISVAPAAAMPPPVPVAVTVIADDPEVQAAGESFLTLLREHGWIGHAAAKIERETLQDCVRRPTDQAACVREAHEWKKEGRPGVVILAVGNPVQHWTCIGVAKAAATPASQTVSIDLREAMFGSPKQRLDLRNKAAACIMAAGSESGW